LGDRGDPSDIDIMGVEFLLVDFIGKTKIVKWMRYKILTP